MRINIGRINQLAVIVAVCSIVLCVLALTIAFALNAQTEAAEMARAASLTEIAETQRWQAQAPSTITKIRAAGAHIAPTCRAAANTNRLLLHIVELANDSEHHVSASIDDLIATYPSPAPIATPSAAPQASLNSMPQNTVLPARTPAPLLGGLNHTGVMEGELAAFHRLLTLEGAYPDVVMSLARLDRAGVPVRLEPPTLNRQGERLVTLKAMITVLVPTPAVCELALAPRESTLVAPEPAAAPVVSNGAPAQ
jgi:hypothetical protein